MDNNELRQLVNRELIGLKEVNKRFLTNTLIIDQRYNKDEKKWKWYLSERIFSYNKSYEYSGKQIFKNHIYYWEPWTPHIEYIPIVPITFEQVKYLCKEFPPSQIDRTTGINKPLEQLEQERQKYNE